MSRVRVYLLLLVFPLVYVIAFIEAFWKGFREAIRDAAGEVRWQHYSMKKAWRKKLQAAQKEPGDE